MTKLAERLARNVRLNDRALVTKFGAAPAVLLVVFVMAAAVSVAALFYTQHAAQQIADHEIRVVAQLGGISGRFEHTEAELSRLLVDRAAGSRAEDVPRRVTTIQSELARIRADLLAIRPRLTAPQQHRVQGVVEQIDRYSEAITVVSSMLDVDFTATVTMLAPFRANADHVVRNLDGMVLAGVNEARAHADLAVSRASWSIGVAIVVLMLLGALGLAMAWLIGATVAASIVRIADATRRLAGGDHDLDLDTFARGDELGQIVSALKVFRAQAIEKAMLEDHALAEEQRRADAVAKANETSRRQRLAMIEELSGAFETKVQGMIHEVKVATHHVEVHAADLQATISAANGLANELEVLAQTFVDEMHEAGIATDELVGAIRRIDQDVDRTSRIATSIRTRAATASRRVSDSDRRAAEVERVVDVIDAIARQTNLLALNASIEAARCGEQGRGFAVVAGEVKALSGRTGSSTDEVRQQVRAVQDGMSEVVAETAALSALIEEMEKVAGSVSDASRAQAQSTGRIETRIRAVNERVETLSHVSAGIRTAAHGNERSLMALRTDSDKLQRALTDLSADARSFTGLLRAG